MSERKNFFVHLVGGGLGGSMGALATCPLEVIQTRLQSSAFRIQRTISTKVAVPAMSTAGLSPAGDFTTSIPRSKFTGILSYARFMVRSEGVFSLYKGLGPTLLGVTPSRAIYFGLYTKLKESLNNSGFFKVNGSLVHMNSAAVASFINHTLTNPLWFVKTRLQLENQGTKRVTALEVITTAYKSEGLRAFYRGLTASYMGISETVLHFAIYEELKQRLVDYHNKRPKDMKAFECLVAAGISKSMATSLCYPHEVARTRLRQQESYFLGKQKYHAFFQTLRTVVREEGFSGLYGGLGTNLLRQVPNTAIMFFTYEAVVHLLENKNDT